MIFDKLKVNPHTHFRQSQRVPSGFVVRMYLNDAITLPCEAGSLDAAWTIRVAAVTLSTGAAKDAT